jgi:SAM-dependent methyltransferase
MEALICTRVTNADRRHGLKNHGLARRQDHHTGHGGHDRAVVAEVLDLDAEVLAEHTAAIVAALPAERAPRRIADLGCGTGAGTFALLTRFPEAQVVAVDSSEDHLARLRRKADEAGVAARIDTITADLDTELPPLGEPDLVWASASLHHLADPERTLRGIHSALNRGGFLVVVEVDGFPRFLPEGAPNDRPGLEERCHELADRRHDARLPHRGADFGPMLTAAGWTIEAHRTITATVEQSWSPAISRYAHLGFARLREVLADELSAQDLAALDRLLDPVDAQSLVRRNDLVMRTRRAVWIARVSGGWRQNGGAELSSP